MDTQTEVQADQLPTKTRDLLLKLRKGATSAFGLGHWTTCLKALGFRVEVVSRENSRVNSKVTHLQVLTPDFKQPRRVPEAPALLDIHKEPHYLNVSFHHLPGWAHRAGFNLSQEASRVLGLPTVEQERSDRNSKARDWTNTGTCAVCGQNVKRGRDGTLVLHGYQRPGDGYAHGNCFGISYEPWELSPKGAVDFVDFLKPQLAAAQRSLAVAVADGAEDYFLRQSRKLERVSRQDPRFQQVRQSEIRHLEREVRGLEQDIKFFSNKVAGWKLDTLPEEKHKASTQAQ